MDDTKKTRTKQLATVIPKIVEAGLTGNTQRLELLCLNTIRSFKQDYPELANQLLELELVRLMSDVTS